MRPQTDPSVMGDPQEDQTVLVVDDEPDILELIGLYVEERLPGVQVLSAPTGPEALELLEARTVNLVLSDFRMPIMDGIEFLAKVRASYPETARILFTAYDDERLRERAEREAGIHSILSKDLSPRDLVGHIEAVLKEQPRRRSV